jgi:hypothetical protein
MCFIESWIIFLAAKYVLPVSKDMPGSDELFDEVSYSQT